VDQLIVIRQVIIDKNMSTINSLYTRTRELFIYAEHFDILEGTVKFYKRNTNVNYDIVEAEQYLINQINNLTTNAFSDTQQAANYIEQYYDKLNTQLISIDKKLSAFSYNNIKETLERSNNDISATMATNYEQMKSDIKRYDSLLIEHISKTSIYLSEAVEKEHARFVQKIASDSNAIIAGISEAVASEIAIQTDLINNSMKKLDDKLFKWFCGAFVGCIFALFACSILSSTWTANKVIGNARVFKIVTGALNTQTTLQKSRHH
jgi:hypothetical protein